MNKKPKPPEYMDDELMLAEGPPIICTRYNTFDSNGDISAGDPIIFRYVLNFSDLTT